MSHSNASIPFSWKYTFLLYAFYIFGFIGLLIWNFLSSAKGLQCTSYYSGNYNGAYAEADQDISAMLIASTRQPTSANLLPWSSRESTLLDRSMPMLPTDLSGEQACWMPA